MGRTVTTVWKDLHGEGNRVRTHIAARDYGTAEEAAEGYEDMFWLYCRKSDDDEFCVPCLVTLNHGCEVVRGCFFSSSVI